MSSIRKVLVPNSLIEKLDQFYNIVIAYQKDHKTDPDYYNDLTKPLNELRSQQTNLMNDISYEHEVSDRYVKIRCHNKDVDSSNDMVVIRVCTNSLNIVIADMKDEIDLFDRKAKLTSGEAETIHTLCKSLIAELSDLSEEVIDFTVQSLIERLQLLNEFVQKQHVINQEEFESHRSDFLNAYKNKPKESKERPSIYLNSLPAINTLKNDVTFFQNSVPTNTTEHSLCKLIIRELNAVSEHAASFKK